jgi:hypothetical protein
MRFIFSGLKQGDRLSPLLINYALEYAIRKVHEKADILRLHGTCLPVLYADDV